ncbi:MAG: PepSY domain-containing protein [Pseudobdellovibrionaceae bacterium]
MINNYPKVSFHFKTWHRRLAIVFVLPLMLVAVTGFFLSVRSYVPAIQPPQKKAAPGFPEVSFEKMWDSIRNLPEAEAGEIGSIKSVEVKVNMGVVNFRLENGYEVQIDAHTGKILSKAKRWTPLLVELHEGLFLSKGLRGFVFIPLGIVVLFLCISGFYLSIPFFKNKRF